MVYKYFSYSHVGKGLLNIPASQILVTFISYVENMHRSIFTNVVQNYDRETKDEKMRFIQVELILNSIQNPVKIKFLDKFCKALLVPMIIITPLKSSAEQVDSTFWFSYGFGAGLSATLCDLVDSGVITNIESKIFTSNFEESLEDPEVTGSFDIEALAQGFNDIVPEFDNCKIKLY